MNELYITFENDDWKTQNPNVITNVEDISSLGFYSANTFTYESKNVFRSGAIGDSQTSETKITFVLAQDGSVEFNYKVSSENNYDWFYVLIDGTQVLKWSGEVDFTVYTQELSAGEHYLTLKYTKDSSQSRGSDCGAIGYLKFTGVEPPMTKKYLVTLDNSEAVYSFDGTALVDTGLLYADLTGDNFSGSGFDNVTTEVCEILKSHVNFKILYWQDDIEQAVPMLKAIVTGKPTDSPTLIFDIDMTNAVSTIKSVSAVYDGSPLIAFSVDNGASWKGYTDSWIDGDMYIANLHLLTEAVMLELLGENKLFKIRITLNEDSEFTSLKIVYEEET